MSTQTRMCVSFFCRQRKPPTEETSNFKNSFFGQFPDYENTFVTYLQSSYEQLYKICSDQPLTYNFRKPTQTILASRIQKKRSIFLLAFSNLQFFSGTAKLSQFSKMKFLYRLYGNQLQTYIVVVSLFLKSLIGSEK